MEKHEDIQVIMTEAQGARAKRDAANKVLKALDSEVRQFIMDFYDFAHMSARSIALTAQNYQRA